MARFDLLDEFGSLYIPQYSSVRRDDCNESEEARKPAQGWHSWLRRALRPLGVRPVVSC